MNKIKMSVRLSEKEYKHLKTQAANAGLKMEPFIRKLIMSIEIRPRPPDNAAQLIKEINAIGHNINQIARKANVFDKVTQDELLEIQRLLGEIYREVKK